MKIDRKEFLKAYENIVLPNLMDAEAKLERRVTHNQSLYKVNVGIWTDLVVNPPTASDLPLSDQPADDTDDINRRRTIYDIKVR
ncbi:hypothetical protein FKX85_18495 [Echinicola soli]|uniref:Uncharacterized protein n=1 Tax=Echinicola soli TaxID=2591634 RepID=A0A514CM72_9BACT|nr:hypothetical protein [Echinicola soli]QDH80925.1 hypothetical protein FKX85_18495 [Echinicola soli]